MADIGVLNLTIHDNSEQAAGSLQKLADALFRVKRAVSGGMKLSGIATQLGKIAQIVDNSISGSTIQKLAEFGDSLARLKGLGNVNINIKATGQIKDAMESVEAGRQSMELIGSTAEEMTESLGEAFTRYQSEIDTAKDSVTGLNESMEEIDEASDMRGAIGNLKEFLEMLHEMHDYTTTPVGRGTWADIAGSIENADQSGEQFYHTMDRTNELVQNMAWSADHMAEQFKEVLFTWLTLRNAMNLGAGQQTPMLMAGEQAETGWSWFNPYGSTAETGWTEWKNGAIEAEGMVLDAENAIIPVLEHTRDLVIYTGEAIKQQTKDINANVEAIRKQQEAKFYANTGKKTYTVEETNKLADQLTKLDLLNAKLRDAQKEYNKLMNTLGKDDTKTIKAGLAVSDLRDKIWEYKHAFDEIKEPKEMGGGLEKVTDMMDASKLDLMTMKLEGMKQALVDDINANKLDNQQIAERMMRIRDLTDRINELNETEEDVVETTDEVRNVWEELKESVTRMFPTLTGLVKKFAQIAKYRILRSVLKHITSGFSEGVQNVYEYSKAIGGSFAPAMDSASTAIQQMKNSIGAAVAPVIQSLIPLLQTVVNWFVNLVNVANQFFSLIRGQQTWTRALPATTTAFSKQEKAAKGAGNAMKDLLASWDELNVIQSESIGNSNGIGTDDAEEYLRMFEEVEKYDAKIKSVVEFIKGNLETVKSVVEDIGIALMAWKLSKSFTGWLSTLATIATVGFVIKLSFDSAGLLDEAYAESGNIGYLIGDTVMTAALAGVAAKLAGAKFGEGAGLITAGLTLAVSAAASFDVANNITDVAKQETLRLLAGVKMGIGAALAAMGFIKAGVNPVLAIVGGVLTVALTTEIVYGLKVRAEQIETAKEAAKKAFAESGAGGINPQDYLNALQDEFDQQTAGAKLVLKAYVEVPDLKDKLTSAMNEIKSFNQLIFHGDGKLSESDAKEFKKAWEIILDTLDSLNEKRYETILAGLTEALNTKSAELRTEVEEIRTTFIMLEQNISAENAEIWKKMQDLTDKMKNGDTSKETLEQYKSYYHVFAAATRSGLEEISMVLDQSKNLDFGDSEHAVDNAKDFVQKVSSAAAEATKAEDDALSSILESTESMRRIEQAKFDTGLIGEEQYKARMKAFDDIVKVATEYAAEKKKEIEGKAQDAWDKVFEQALSTGSLTESYWSEVLIPLMKEAKEAGYKIPKAVAEAWAEGVGSPVNVQEFHISPFDFIDELKDKTAEEIVKELNTGVEADFSGRQQDIIGHAIENLFVSHNNVGLSTVQLEARDLIEVKGWDNWSKDIKRMFIEGLRDAAGEEKAKSVAELLGFDWSLLIPSAEDAVQEATNDAAEDVRDTIRKTLNNALYEGVSDTDFEELVRDLSAEYGEDIVGEIQKEIDTPIEPPTPDLTAFNRSLADSAQFLREWLWLRDMMNKGDQGTSYSGAYAMPHVKIPGFATGGFPDSGSLFMADENGNIEMKGKMGNQAVVANNQQIVSGISQGVSTANESVVSELRTVVTMLQKIMSKEFVARATPGSDWGRHNARSEAAYDRVTGV